MESLYQILNLVATALLIPTIIGLLFLFIRALLLIGTFYGNYADRAKFRKNIKPALQQLERGEADIDLAARKRHLMSKYLQQMIDVEWHGIRAEKLLTEMQMEYKKQLEPLKILMRSGPMLGLMGTLIPMGPALAGLASGDIGSMALNMQLAFSTTVLGIFIGLSAFVLLEIQKRWANEDFSELEYLYESIQDRRSDS
jgi:biopolymer transport protein ExbB/TolQ